MILINNNFDANAKIIFNARNKWWCNNNGNECKKLKERKVHRDI